MRNVDGTDGDREDGFAAVLAAAVSGQDWAIAQLFRDLHPRIRRFVLSQEPHAADDIEGEVWEAVAKGLHEFTGGELGLRAWVFTITRRRIVQHRRTQGRHRTDVVAPAELEVVAAADVPDQAAVERLGAEEAVALVRQLLTEEQAEVVLLRVLGGLDAVTVGEMLGRTETWVRVTQHRALRKLADRIGPKLGVTP